MTSQQHLDQYLRSQVPSPPMHNFVLGQGSWYASESLSASELSTVLDAARRAQTAFPPRHCFANTALLVLADTTGELQYVEGFTVSAVLGLPIHHAWATLRDKVVDVTLTRREPVVLDHPLADRILGHFGEHRAYIGVTFDRDRVLHRLTTAADHVAFLDAADSPDPMVSQANR